MSVTMASVDTPTNYYNRGGCREAGPLNRGGSGNVDHPCILPHRQSSGQDLVTDRPTSSRPDQLGVLGQHSALVLGGRRLPRGGSLGKFVSINQHIQCP